MITRKVAENKLLLRKGKTHFHVEMPDELLGRIIALADREERTKSAMARILIKEALSHRETARG